jgi:hypothetical protein
MNAIKILAFADLNSAAALEAVGFNVGVDDAINRVIYAEAETSDILNALNFCEELSRLNIVGSVFYNDEDYYTDEFFNKEFSNKELGLE